MKTERELFNEWLKYYEKHDVVIDQLQRAFMWQAWQASAQRQGYKLVLLDHMSVIRDALVIACDSGKNYQRYEDSLNYVHKAMMGENE